MPTLADALPPAPSDAAALAVADEVTEMNGDDWSTLAVAVRPGDPVVLEFRFSAPNEPAADELAEFLGTVDYESATAAPESDFDDWSVAGVTLPATTDEADLAEWVRRMAAAGLAHGGATLDGWALVLE